MKEFVIDKETTERTVLVGLITPQQDETKVREYLDELAFLANTAGAVTVRRFTQKVDYPNPRTFVGKGKLEEIKLQLWTAAKMNMTLQISLKV